MTYYKFYLFFFSNSINIFTWLASATPCRGLFGHHRIGDDSYLPFTLCPYAFFLPYFFTSYYCLAAILALKQFSGATI
jgi:hypothetical protein